MNSTSLTTTLLLAAALLLTACPDQASQAPQSPSAKAQHKPATEAGAWQQWEKYLQDQSHSPHQKLRRLEEFARTWPGSPHADALAQQRSRLQAEVKADLDQQALQTQEAREKLAQLHQARAREITLDSPARLIDYIFFDLTRWAFDQDQSPDATLPEPLHLQFQGQERRLTRPLYFGLGSIRVSLFTQMRRLVPEMISREDPSQNTAQQNFSFNKLLHDRLQGDLFRLDKPGELNKDALTRLLPMLDLKPDTPLLGLSARALFETLKAPIRDYARIYLTIKHKPGLQRAREAYIEASQINGPGQINENMPSSYANFRYEHLGDIPPPDRPEYNMLVGFWLRRIHDGTDALLFDFLMRKIREFDPAMAKELDASP